MRQLQLVVVTANPSGNAARITHYVARSVGSVRVVGAIVDLGTSRDRRRQRARIAAWHRHGGFRYASWRLSLHLRDRFQPTPAARYRFSLEELGREFSFPVIAVPSINSSQAEGALHALDADVGLSVGNRLIYESIYSIPRYGMINLHHGRMPDFRGGPPAFWELYEGRPSMGVSVHRIDAQVDHGELLAREEVPVLASDDPRTLMERAYSVDVAVVGRALEQLASGTPEPIVVDPGGSMVRTLPSRAEIRRLEARLGRAVRHDDYRRAVLPDLPPD